MNNNFDAFNLYLFNQGKLEKAYELFGSHLVKDENGNTLGTIFRVYAPNAKFGVVA